MHLRKSTDGNVSSSTLGGSLDWCSIYSKGRAQFVALRCRSSVPQADAHATTATATCVCRSYLCLCHGLPEVPRHVSCQGRCWCLCKTLRQMILLILLTLELLGSKNVLDFCPVHNVFIILRNLTLEMPFFFFVVCLTFFIFCISYCVHV